MNKIISLILASICMMQVASAQDLLTIKMNQIDEYRENILSSRKNFLNVKYPLNMHLVSENSCYIDYEKPDTIVYYFQDNKLVLIEHRMDRKIDNYNCDTGFTRAVEYKRAFFLQGKICLEEHYDSSYLDGWVRLDNGKRGGATYCYITVESRTYWDITIDKKVVSKYRGTKEYILETKVDSVMDATEWKIKYVDKSSWEYEYDSGKEDTRDFYLSVIKENGFTLPEGVKMPYSE